MGRSRRYSGGRHDPPDRSGESDRRDRHPPLRTHPPRGNNKYVPDSWKSLLQTPLACLLAW